MSEDRAPIYRKVEIDIWTDERVRRLTRPPANGRDLWLYLLTARESIMIPGIIPVGAGTIADTLLWSERGVKQAFAEIEEQGMAKADWKHRLVFLPKAIHHNAPVAPNVILHWAKGWKHVPECPLRDEAFFTLKTFVDTMHPGFQQAFAQVFAGTYPKAFNRRAGDRGSLPPMPSGDAFPPCLPPMPSPEGIPPSLPPMTWGDTASSEQRAVSSYKTDGVVDSGPADHGRPVDNPNSRVDHRPPTVGKTGPDPTTPTVSTVGDEPVGSESAAADPPAAAKTKRSSRWKPRPVRVAKPPAPEAWPPIAMLTPVPTAGGDPPLEPRKPARRAAGALGEPVKLKAGKGRGR